MERSWNWEAADSTTSLYFHFRTKNNKTFKVVFGFQIYLKLGEHLDKNKNKKRLRKERDRKRRGKKGEKRKKKKIKRKEKQKKKTTRNTLHCDQSNYSLRIDFSYMYM